MPEHFLYGTQVTRGLQHMRGEGMAQHVWVHMTWQALGQGTHSKAFFNHARMNAPAAHPDKQGDFLCQREFRTLIRPGGKCLARQASDRNKACLGTLAQDADFSAQRILKTLNIECNEFR